MKLQKILIASFVLMLVSFTIVACKSGATTGGDKISTKAMSVGEIEGVPEFYLSPPVSQSLIYGVGSAKLSKLDATRKASLAKAREDVAFQVKIQVESSIADYYKETGNAEDSVASTFYNAISNQVASTILKGITTEKVVPSKDGTLYALVSFPKENILSATQEALAKNASGAFDGFNSSDAIATLENNLNNNPTTPGQNQ